MPRGTCKLCLQHKELIDSHLMPAGIFRLLRGTKWTNPNPAVITSDWIGQSSEQITDHVFCRECENVFNDGGERWLIQRLARLEGFPLYDTLAKYTPFYLEDSFATYDGSEVTEIDAAKITHFGMGMFWKAAVHSWKTKVFTIRIDVGPYAEGIRRFLLGGPFPDRMALWVCVLPPTVPLLSALVPLQIEKKEFHMFSFYVPGVEFVLSVGKQVPDFIKTGCFATSPMRPIMSSSQFAFQMGRSYRQALATARISPKYAEQQKKSRKG